jgi:phosphoesterase RecJ-like protein
MRQVLSTVERSRDGRVAYLRQTLEMAEKSGAVDGDNNGFVNIPLSAKEVLAVVYMREVRPNEYRVSLRSKGDINVARVAEQFGGGGHKNAAGCRVEGDWNDCEKQLVEAMTETVEKWSDEYLEDKRDYELTLA